MRIGSNFIKVLPGIAAKMYKIFAFVWFCKSQSHIRSDCQNVSLLWQNSFNNKMFSFKIEHQFACQGVFLLKMWVSNHTKPLVHNHKHTCANNPYLMGSRSYSFFGSFQRKVELIITLLRIHIWWDTYPFPITHVAFSHSSPIAVENRAFVYTTTHRGKLKELCKRWHNMNVAISAPFIALPPLLFQLFQSKKMDVQGTWLRSDLCHSLASESICAYQRRKTKDQKSRTRDQGSKSKDQGSKIKDRGSMINDRESTILIVGKSVFASGSLFFEAEFS